MTAHQPTEQEMEQGLTTMEPESQLSWINDAFTDITSCIRESKTTSYSLVEWQDHHYSAPFGFRVSNSDMSEVTLPPGLRSTTTLKRLQPKTKSLINKHEGCPTSDRPMESILTRYIAAANLVASPPTKTTDKAPPAVAPIASKYIAHLDSLKTKDEAPPAVEESMINKKHEDCLEQDSILSRCTAFLINSSKTNDEVSPVVASTAYEHEDGPSSTNNGLDSMLSRYSFYRNSLKTRDETLPTTVTSIATEDTSISLSPSGTSFNMNAKHDESHHTANGNISTIQVDPKPPQEMATKEATASIETTSSHGGEDAPVAEFPSQRFPAIRTRKCLLSKVSLFQRLRTRKPTLVEKKCQPERQTEWEIYSSSEKSEELELY